MGRPEKIAKLKVRYAQLVSRRAWRAAGQVWVKLHDLMNSQLRVENRLAAKDAQ